MQRLILIGMPGAGKTYWAQIWGQASGTPVLDLDAEIERATGTSIPDLFAAEGEAGFRNIEHQVLQQVLSQTGTFILATGGGTPCFENNLPLLLQSGNVVYLDVPVPELVQRIRAQKQQRPLLAQLSDTALTARLEQLLTEREFFYRQAHQTLPAEALSAATFALL
ncbi:MAG: shikimate kinase [Sphingobacteriales bacterium]|nr:MAG: shikimate kinase [Sphingobacteriales bacterium]